MAQEKTVLLVDDDEEFMTQQKVQLVSKGFSVLTASSGAQAQKLILDKKPDVAIVDLMMEEPDSGLVLTYKIKKHYPAVPVIMLAAVTSTGGIEFAEDARKEKSWVKADAILQKPVRAEQLMGEITRLMV